MGKKNKKIHSPLPGARSPQVNVQNNYLVRGSGLPPAEEIQKFAVISPDLPLKIMNDALAHSEAARENEKKMVSAVASEASANAFAVRVRIVVISAILISFFGLALFLIYLGRTLEGFAVLVLPIIWAVKKFEASSR